MKFILIIALCLLSNVAVPNDKYPAKSGSIVEIHTCTISWWIWRDTWQIRCDYQIDGGDIIHAENPWAYDNVELRLPGTSVVLQMNDWSLSGILNVTHDEDIREIIWGESTNVTQISH